MSDAPPVLHASFCGCLPCSDARRHARAEELAGRYSAFLERMSGPVYARLGAPRKPMPGTAKAIRARYR